VTQSPGEPTYQELSEGSVFATDNGIRLTQLPTTVRLEDIQVFPRTSDTSVTVLLDGEAVLETSDRTYEILITEQGNQTIQIESTDQET
jgi:hypothetical protein